MDSTLVLLAFAVVILFWLYKRFNSSDDTLEAQGIAHEKPIPVFGNIWSLITQQEGGINFFERCYRLFPNEKLYGFYGFFGHYGLALKHPSLVKQMLIKDFDSFVNRDRNENNLIGDKYLGRSLLMLRDQKWRDMRTMLSPIYTSSKIKYMYGLLTECAKTFVDVYEEKAKANGENIEIETHDVFARTTADGISTTALGFEGDCVINKDSKIYEIADALEADFTNPKTAMLLALFPKIFRLLGKQLFRKSIHEFFEANVLGEIERRREGNIVRPDVIQMLIQAKEGQLKVESGDAEEISYTETKVRKITNWTDEDLVAQAFVLFLGGFETTATLMQSISYEMAHNPKVQQTLIDEVDEMLEELGGETISYDQLNQMKYLDMVVSEALRKWPSFRAVARHCSKDYIIKDDESGKTYKIYKGVDVAVPIGAIQMDPQFFPNPETFDPTRFSDENKSKIQSGSYLPFGLGPRMCIGSRYAILEAKLLLYSVMTKFSIEKCSKTPDKLTFTKGNTGYNEKIYVNFKLRKN